MLFKLNNNYHWRKFTSLIRGFVQHKTGFDWILPWAAELPRKYDEDMELTKDARDNSTVAQKTNNGSVTLGRIESGYCQS